MVWFHGGGYTIVRSGPSMTAPTWPSGATSWWSGQPPWASGLPASATSTRPSGPRATPAPSTGGLARVGRDNIARFGGDPGNVTISAIRGWRQVCSMLAMRGARPVPPGVVQSGAAMYLSPPERPRPAPTRCGPSSACPPPVPSPPCGRCRAPLCSPPSRRLRRQPRPDGSGFGPVLDGEHLPQHRQGGAGWVGADVPLMIGPTFDEATLSGARARAARSVPLSEADLDSGSDVGAGRHLLAAYRASRPSHADRPDDRLQTDAISACRRSAGRAQAAAAMLPCGCTCSPGGGADALRHGYDLPFVFHKCTSRC